MHLIATPAGGQSVARALRQAPAEYVQAFNRRGSRSGNRVLAGGQAG